MSRNRRPEPRQRGRDSRQVRFFVVVMAIVAGYLVPSPSSRFTSRSLAHTLSLFTHTFPVLVLHKDITTIS
ncbi:hypothetical protein MLD38_020196 [Melastoma candidum]|uniref:Uncharacterized protein n=1 Tax=Melastoma candidum TaxID=119954 RepID=A0ACB9QD38_9MYRT|nr:hypothetical protein MLD38_020196 [Melastoma candidum]